MVEESTAVAIWYCMDTLNYFAYLPYRFVKPSNYIFSTGSQTYITKLYMRSNNVLLSYSTHSLPGGVHVNKSGKYRIMTSYIMFHCIVLSISL